MLKKPRSPSTFAAPANAESRDAEVARRWRLADEIIADGLITLMIKERLQQLEGADAELAAAEQDVERAGVRKCRAERGARGRNGVPVAGAPFGRTGTR
jgi:hypothetical protein